MPCSHTIDLEKGWVYVKLSGTLRGEDLEEHLRDLTATLHLPSPYRQLCDLREVETFELSGDDARHVIAVLTRRPEIRGGRLAFVSGRPLIYGMCRVFEALANGALEVGVFHELSVAEDFLFQGKAASASAEPDASAESPCPPPEPTPNPEAPKLTQPSRQ